MRKPYQSPGRMRNSSYCIAPVGDWTHDLPHTVASNMVNVSHALNHSATEAIHLYLGVINVFSRIHFGQSRTLLRTYLPTSNSMTFHDQTFQAWNPNYQIPWLSRFSRTGTNADIEWCRYTKVSHMLSPTFIQSTKFLLFMKIIATARNTSSSPQDNSVPCRPFSSHAARIVKASSDRVDSGPPRIRTAGSRQDVSYIPGQTSHDTWVSRWSM